MATVVAAGFVDFSIPWRAEIYAGAAQSSSAAEFGTLGITFRARRPASVDEWEAALAHEACALPPATDERR